MIGSWVAFNLVGAQVRMGILKFVQAIFTREQMIVWGDTATPDDEPDYLYYNCHIRKKCIMKTDKNHQLSDIDT